MSLLNQGTTQRVIMVFFLGGYRVELARSTIEPQVLNNLCSSMPKRILRCIQLDGGYIGKYGTNICSVVQKI